MGLLAGTSHAVKSVMPSTEIVAVEPDGAASLEHALLFGQAKNLDEPIDTFVDGAAVRKVGHIPFSLAKDLVSRVVKVNNRELRAETTALWERQRPIKAELAGVLAVAGLRKQRSNIRNKRVVCLLSGGNLSRNRYLKDIKLN
ncbi:MAG: hypothetical protein NVS1B10_06010 [Candidatus Saccharimonadales bacterium]